MSRHASQRKRAASLLAQRRRARAAMPESPDAASARPQLLPLGALAAGFGLWSAAAVAQTQPAAATPPAAAASAPAETALPPVRVKGRVENDNTAVRATTTTVGKGNQDVRDIPQSLTIVTEKLMDDRNLDTVKEALRNTSGITFQAAEGGEEDIRLRGFSLAGTRRHLPRRHARPGVLRPRHLQLRPRRAAARLGLDAVRPRLHRRRGQPGEQAAASRSTRTRSPSPPGQPTTCASPATSTSRPANTRRCASTR